MVKKKETTHQIEDTIKLVKITNPMWIQIIAPRIVDYHKIVSRPFSTYESLMVYLTGIVQFGGDNSELWVAFKDDAPVGICVWMIMGPPNFGAVHCDQIYVWDDDPIISRMFFEKFLKFAESKRAPYVHGLFINKKVADHFIAIAEEFNITPIHSESIEVYGRR